jgi:ATP-dependent RNA helicase RhlE
MFDMGFIRDVRRIAASVSKNRQTLLFSATMPNDIAKLSSEILKNPEKVEIAPQGRTVEKIDQRVYFVNAANKRTLLNHLLSDETLERVIIFTRTKRGANRVAEALEDRGVRSEAIHGNKSQNARQKALDNFARGKARVLVATDLASRGIDVQGVTHVINFELPADAESYVHRIGRTARAGASGIAISFCDGSERGQLKGIERLTNQRIPVVPTPANEDMPPAPPVRARAEGDDRDDRRDERPRESRGGPRGGGRPGGHRSFGDRSNHDRSRGDRPPAHADSQFRGGDFRDAPRGERSFGDRAHGDRPRGDHPRGDRPYGDRPQGDRPQGDRRHGDRPHGDRPHGDRPHHGRPQGERSFGDRPRGDRFDQAQRDRSQGDRPNHEGGHHASRPHGDRHHGDRPYGDRPQGDRPQGDRPYGDRPQGPRPQWKGRRFGGGRGRAA